MKKILIVVDMQNDFVDGALGTTEAQKIVKSVVEKIKAYHQEGDTVYFTQDTHGEDYLDTQEGRNLPIKHCIKGTKGWALVPDVDVLKETLKTTSNEAIVFEKEVFGSQRLAAFLKEKFGVGNGVEFEIVGLCTDICVLSNAIVLKTYMPQANIKVDASCCAGVTPESHKNALDAMKMCHIQINN